MPVALLVVLIPFITSIFSGVKKTVDDTADGKYNKIIGWLLIAVVAYLIIRGFNKSKEQTYLDTMGSDKNSQQAAALRDAMNRSGVESAMNVDGTDEDLIFATARSITDYKGVADSYRVIYHSELTTDLQKELNRADFQSFFDIVNGTNSGSLTTTTSSAGKTIVATQTLNVRTYEDYTKVDHQAKAGEVLGTYIGEQSLMISGQVGTFYIGETTGFLGLFKSKFYALKSACKLT